MSSNEPAILADRHGRPMSYLRLSVTDRCNLRCTYCRGLGPFVQLPHEDILRFSEILRVVGILRDLGIRKVRLTGGEPLARRNFAGLLEALRTNFPDLELRITSNGTMLEPYVPLFSKVRLGAVNLSIDSFRRETFARLTGRDLLPQVLSSLHALLNAGIRVKINAVAMRGANDQEMADFIGIIRDLPVDLRFIEFMPMGSGTVWNESAFWSASDILADAARFASLSPVPRTDADPGPARMYTVEGCKGRLGVISAVTSHFCADCNRLRLTSDGQLRTCLFADSMTPLRDLLRRPETSDAAIAEAIRKAAWAKPIGAELLRNRNSVAVASGKMSGIGG